MMDTFMLKPTVLAYDTCKEMAEALQIGEGDLMITNKYIYDPYFADLHLKCDVLFQEKYGAGVLLPLAAGRLSICPNSSH